MAKAPSRVYLGLGGNLADPLEAFARAIRALAAHGSVVAISSAYRSRALVPEGAPPGPDFWNTVVAFDTELDPSALLVVCLDLEARAGRVRRERWAARTLDLDILLFADLSLSTPALTLPHPRLAERLFVLRPLLELAPELRLPGTGVALAELLGAHADPNAGMGEVRREWFGAGDA